MTDSRVEAVARAIAKQDGWDYDRIGNRNRATYSDRAQAAIEASDAWLKGQDQGQMRMVDVICSKCGASGVRREDLTHSDYWMHCSVCSGRMQPTPEDWSGMVTKT